jgi:hypothetical protein
VWRLVRLRNSIQTTLRLVARLNQLGVGVLSLQVSPMMRPVHSFAVSTLAPPHMLEPNQHGCDEGLLKETFLWMSDTLLFISLFRCKKERLTCDASAEQRIVVTAHARRPSIMVVLAHKLWGKSPEVAMMKTDRANYSCLLVLSPSWLGKVTSGSQTAAHRDSYAIAVFSVN